MTKNPPQKLKVPAVPQVRHRKGVSQRVRREADASDTALPPEHLEIPFKVATGDFSIVLCPKYESGSPATEKAKQALAKLDREGYKAMLSAFAQYPHGELFEVYIFFRQSKNLRRSKSSIKNRKGNEVGSKEIRSGRSKST